MSIDERDRLALHEAARETWGPEIAVTLMEMLPPGGWAEVATKSDLAVSRSELRTEAADLRTELRTGLAEVRTEMADLRTELRTEMAEVRTEMAEVRTELRTGLAAVRVEMSGLSASVDRSMRTLTMWMITTLIAGSGLIAAVSAATR